MNRKSKLVHIIKRSCLTGKVVWIYHGHSHEAGRKAYARACKKEVRRVRYLWGLMVARRGKNIMRLLTACTERMPITAILSKEQKLAARQLKKLAKCGTSCDRDFYNHIIEESKRCNEKSGRWRTHRQKWIKK